MRGEDEKIPEDPGPYPQTYSDHPPSLAAETSKSCATYPVGPRQADRRFLTAACRSYVRRRGERWVLWVTAGTRQKAVGRAAGPQEWLARKKKTYFGYMGGHGKIPVSARTPEHCKREWCGGDTNGGLVLLLEEVLLLPAVIHRVHDVVIVVAMDRADEEDLDIVLDGDDLGVIDTGLPRQPFTVDLDLHPDRREAELRLSIEAL